MQGTQPAGFVRRYWDLLIALLSSPVAALGGFLGIKDLGLPVILFTLGYSLISFLFPKEGTLDTIERLALSFGLSLSMSALVAFILKVTFGMSFRAFIYILSTITAILSALAVFRRGRVESPYVPNPEVLKQIIGWYEMSRLEKALTLILLITLIVLTSYLIYLIENPRQLEKFTEFYILGPSGKAAGYPRVLRVGENGTVIIGIVNHEGRVVNYTVEVWAVEMRLKGNRTYIRHMYFLDEFRVRLKPVPINLENWTPEWQRRYNFSINKTGKFKVFFLLFKGNPPPLPKRPRRMMDFANTTAVRLIREAINGKIQCLYLNVIVRRI